MQTLQNFALTITPLPIAQSQTTDLAGIAVLHLIWSLSVSWVENRNPTQPLDTVGFHCVLPNLQDVSYKPENRYNAVVKVWFAPDSVTVLDIQVQSQVVTHQSDSFNYLLEPWALPSR